MARTKVATTSIFFNKYKPQKDGKCPVSIRVTYDREKRHYALGRYLVPEDYEKVFSQKPRKEFKDYLLEFTSMQQKADDVLKTLRACYYSAML